MFVCICEGFVLRVVVYSGILGVTHFSPPSCVCVFIRVYWCIHTLASLVCVCVCSMSGQKPLHFLRSTRFWSIVQNFLDDPVSSEHEFPRLVTAAERDQIRQICKHFDVPFKVHGEGTEKYMVIRKPDFSYFDDPDESSPLEQMKKLCVKLAKLVAFEKTKYQVVIDKLREESLEPLVSKILSEIEYHQTSPAFSKLVCCGDCEDTTDLRMSVNCGHFSCSSCSTAKSCKQCGHEFGLLIDVDEPQELKTEQTDPPLEKKPRH